MQTSIFLARLMGPVMFVIGLSLAINSKIYTEMSAEFVASRPLVYLAGAFALTLGVSLLLNHNVWAADWRIIITLFGWFATINGVLRLMFPDWVRRSRLKSLSSFPALLQRSLVRSSALPAIRIENPLV